MNPIKWIGRQIKSIFSFIIDDIKTDIGTVKEVSKRIREEKPIFSESFMSDLKRYFHEFTIGGFIKEYWMSILFCALCYVAGWWLSSQYYQIQCNNVIVDALREAALSGQYDITKLNFTWNVTGV
jgi:hypothetical protein